MTDTTSNAIDLVEDQAFMDAACTILRRYVTERDESQATDELIFEADYVVMLLEMPALAAHVAAAVEAERERIVPALMPDVGHSSQPPAQVLVDAAWKLRNGYDAGGSNVSTAIATLLDRVAAAIDPNVLTTYQGDRPWPPREVEDLLGEAQIVRAIGSTPVRHVEDGDRAWFTKHPLAAIAGSSQLDVVIDWLEARS